MAFDGTHHANLLCNVALRTTDADDVKGFVRKSSQRSSYLTGRTKDEDAHVPVSRFVAYSVFSRTPRRSPEYFSERSGPHQDSLARYHSMVARSPDSKLC